MSEQPRFFYEDVYDALKGAVGALGGAKVVGPLLWPQKPVSEAQRDILDCLNRDRPRKLDLEETMLILRKAREVGFHGAMTFFAESCGYEKPTPTDPVIQRDRLAEEFSKVAIEFQRLQALVKRMSEHQLERVA